MKKMMVAAVAVFASALSGAWALSLADASAGIGKAIDNPSAIAEAVKQLAPADKTAYLAKVNEAISKLPGSADEKAGKYLQANTAAMRAMKGESKDATMAMLAEVYATVPPEALTLVNENFAGTLFSRESGKVSDEAMKQIAVDAMKAIKDRNAGNDNENVRDAFAVLMFIRASGGKPEDLRKTLTDMLPSQEAREVAAAEWFPAALGEGRDKTYEPMLAVANVDKAPAIEDDRLVDDRLALQGEGIFNGSLLADLAVAGSTFSDMYLENLRGSPYPTIEHGLYTIPRTTNPDAPYNSSYRRGGGEKGSDNVDRDGGGSEPIPYRGQGRIN